MEEWEREFKTNKKIHQIFTLAFWVIHLSQTLVLLSSGEGGVSIFPSKIGVDGFSQLKTEENKWKKLRRESKNLSFALTVGKSHHSAKLGSIYRSGQEIVFMTPLFSSLPFMFQKRYVWRLRIEINKLQIPHRSSFFNYQCIILKRGIRPISPNTSVLAAIVQVKLSLGTYWTLKKFGSKD